MPMNGLRLNIWPTWKRYKTMTTKKAAVDAIVKQFLDYIDARGEVPKETYTSPMTNRVERNAVTIDVRQLKILAGLPLEKE